MLELEISEKYIFTIKRFLRGDNINQIFLYECSIEEIQRFKPIELGINARSANSISSYLMQILNYQDKKVLSKSKTKTTKQVTLRTLTNFIIVDETNIISEKSPVFIDNYDNTYKKSLFKFLLTGIDDGEIEQVEDPQIVKAKLFAKIEVYTNLTNKAAEELEKLGNDFDSEELDKRINSLENQYAHNTVLLNQKITERTALINKQDEVKDALIESNRLLNRYKLLTDYYESDTERLDFLEEGSFYLNQLHNFPCPICKNEQIPETEDFKNVINACKEEFKKINEKILDLRETISKEEFKINDKQMNLTEINVKISDLTKEIDEELNPYASVLKKRINDILVLQKKVELKSKLRSDIELYSQNRKKCQSFLDNYKTSNYSNPISNQFYADFAKEVSTILTDWKYKENCKVIFDDQKFDIEIDGQPRGHQGKGHRALTRSAFVLGLQNYMYNKDFAYPGFVILDSPLLSLKEADIENTNVSDTVQNAFWESVSGISNCKQIIIFENKEPNESIKAKSHFIKFTGLKNNGRIGFYQ